MSSEPRPRLSIAHDRDAEARRRAVEERQSFIVQAPAGSGKTELLIQRYLALLANVEEPESIVAITFTRKAAAEMLARVLKALHQARGDEPEREHERDRWRLARQVLARDTELSWNLAQNPARMRILTIDALCHGIVKLMPWTSKLGASRNVIDDGGEFYRAAAHRTIQLLGEPGVAGQHVRRALEHLDNDVPQLESQIAGMLQRRDQWMRHMPQGDTANLRRAMEKVLRRVICERLEEVRDLVPRNVHKRLTRMGRFAAENLERTDPSHPIVQCSGLQGMPECSADAIGVWCGIVTLVLTGKGEWRAEGGLDKRVGFPKTHPAEKLEFIDLLEELRQNPGLDKALHSIRKLPPAKFSDEQWEILRSLAQVLPTAVEQLRAVFLQEQTCDFSEISQAAQHALGDRRSPTDLALALGHDIQHLLVDEFQDTSISQVELFETLIANWKPGDGRTIFLVGDPMQSIYRFRQAEVASFLRVREQRNFGPYEIIPLTLTKNFRSRQSVVDWVNRVFPELFPPEQDLAASAVVFEKSESAAKDRTEASDVRVHAQFGHDYNGQEARAVVELVRELRVRHKKVAILARGRNHLFNIVPRLRQAAVVDPGLRFQAVEIDKLGEQVVISDLRALTNALLHLGHRAAWLAVLRAPWCGLTLPDLHAICGDNNIPGTVWDLLRERLSTLSPEGQQRAGRIIPVLAKALERRGRLPLRQWIESTWISLHGPAGLREKRDLEDADAFFDLLDELDCGSDLESLAHLEESISRLHAQPDPEATDAIQVMTIHKAKGLEFDAVILPGLGKTTRGGDKSLILWDERATEHGPELLMAPIPPEGEKGDPIYDYLKTVEGEREGNELRRLLYVGVTRAKHELHLFGHAKQEAQEFGQDSKPPANNTFLKLLWPALESEFKRQAQAIVDLPKAAIQLAASADPAAQLMLRRMPLDWSVPELPSPLAWKPSNDPEPVTPEDDVTYDWAGERARRVGTVVHAVLQRIAEEGLAKWSAEQVRGMRPTLRAALGNQGVSPADMEDAVAKTEQAIVAALRHEKGRWILSPHEDARNELALTSNDGGQLYSVAMDRTFVDGGVRWIVDYKTSSHEGGDPEGFLDNEVVRYKEKMERYARILRKFDKRPVKIGLFFPLMSGWREWEAE